jgi:carbon-monoxide dehydrogenase small subunit
MPSSLRTIGLTVNGEPHTCTVEPRRTLADCLRHDLGLTGTHVGCEHGVCGCCTVLVDGQPVRSCLLFAVQADGGEVLTVEGLSRDGALHPLQQAFWEGFALQCGFCTPGFLLTALAFLRDRPDPTADEVRRALAGNLCRCTGYHTIVRAVLRAAQTLRAAGPESWVPSPSSRMRTQDAWGGRSHASEGERS